VLGVARGDGAELPCSAMVNARRRQMSAGRPCRSPLGGDLRLALLPGWLRARRLGWGPSVRARCGHRARVAPFLRLPLTLRISAWWVGRSLMVVVHFVRLPVVIDQSVKREPRFVCTRGSSELGLDGIVVEACDFLPGSG
jgi:hypothetical protein